MPMYDIVNARLLLASLTIKPYLLNGDKYNLNKSDFTENLFHLRLFQGIQYLAKHGAKSISAIELYALTENNDEVKELYDVNNLPDFLESMSKLANVDNIDVYYDAVRKCTILNEFNAHGFDISKFELHPENYTIDDIINYYEGLQIEVKKNFYKNGEIEEVVAGEGFQEIKDGFKESPMWGSPFLSNNLTEILRGWQRGQLTCISCDSGMGKSTFNFAQLVKVCATQVYNTKINQFVENPYCEHCGGLIIQYEMNAKKEITPRLVSTISGVPCYHILDGQYDDGEEERVDKAIEILKESQIYIVTMPQFTVDTVESYVKDYVINKNVQFVVFDYLSEQASASLDLVKKSGTSQRTDQILAQIASKLKDIAVIYNVAVLTSTQVNYTIHSAKILDAGVIASSRSVQNKLDCGVVMHELRKDEQDFVALIEESNKYGVNKYHKPNRIFHIYKARFGSYEPNLKVYIHLDLSTGRVEDFFVTDKDNKFYDIRRLKQE